MDTMSVLGYIVVCISCICIRVHEAVDCVELSIVLVGKSVSVRSEILKCNNEGCTVCNTWIFSLVCMYVRVHVHVHCVCVYTIYVQAYS